MLKQYPVSESHKMQDFIPYLMGFLRIGETVMRHIENVMVLAWRDKQTVKMVTTCHENNMEEVEVWQRGHKEKNRKAKTSMHCGIQ